MDPTSIQTSSQWAQRTEAYEAMVEAGDIGQESVASAAGRVRRVQGEVPELTALMGTHLKQRLAYFETPPAWTAIRRFSRLTAASLGSYELREECKTKLRHHLGQLVESAARHEEPRVMALELVIDETIANDRLIDEVIGRQGEFLSAG